MAERDQIMEDMAKLTYARLLFADFILADDDEKEIINKIKEFGFRELDKGKSLSFEIGTTRKAGDFIEQLQSACKSDPAPLEYINNIIVHINRNSILPHNAVIIEVILNVDGLQKLKKQDLESKTWNLFLLLGEYFSEPSTPAANSSKGLHILKFSSKAILRGPPINSVADFVFNAEPRFFNGFSKKLDSLEKITKGGAVLMQGLEAVRKEVITLEPISFLDGGFSYDQSIVKGYGDRVFIIGKILQGSIADSIPIYLATMISATYDNISPYLASRPVLVFHGVPLLDFSFGPGQILALQLLNSWNRYEGLLIKDLTTKQTPVSINIKTEIEGDLEELRNLISYRGINQRISINLQSELLDLADPSAKTFLYEFPMPLEAASILSSMISENPERYGLEKPGPLVSKLGALVLNGLKLNEKHLYDLISFKRSRINILKIEEDRKYSRIMYRLTAIVAIATIVNIILFLILHF